MSLREGVEDFRTRIPRPAPSAKPEPLVRDSFPPTVYPLRARSPLSLLPPLVRRRIR